MTLKNKHKNRMYKNAKHLIGLLNNLNKRAQIFIGFVNADANSIISPWNFLDRHFALTSFEKQ